MAFIPNPNARPAGDAPRSPGLSSPPRPSSDDGTGFRGRPLRVVGAIAVGLILLYQGWDLSQRFRERGIYRYEYQGQVVSARPRFDDLFDLFTSSRHDRGSISYSSSWSRDYLLTLRDDSGHTSKVAVDRYEYHRTKIPEYVVSRGGRLEHFVDRKAAEAAGKVPPLAAP